jgi:hypothetical protein
MATRKTTRIKASSRKAAAGPTCTVEGCDKPIYVRGLCEVHWADPKK